MRNGGLQDIGNEALLRNRKGTTAKKESCQGGKLPTIPPNPANAPLGWRDGGSRKGGEPAKGKEGISGIGETGSRQSSAKFEGKGAEANAGNHSERKKEKSRKKEKY